MPNGSKIQRGFRWRGVYIVKIVMGLGKTSVTRKPGSKNGESSHVIHRQLSPQPDVAKSRISFVRKWGIQGIGRLYELKTMAKGVKVGWEIRNICEGHGIPDSISCQIVKLPTMTETLWFYPWYVAGRLDIAALFLHNLYTYPCDHKERGRDLLLECSKWRSLVWAPGGV